LFSDPCSSRTQALLDWYSANARDLPWRHTRDPYRIWISEIMLQQTQVKTVLPRFTAWFETFPDIVSLATASLDDVLKAWEGLGYYRRARFIHASARLVLAEYHGRFPQAFESMLKLPGIGRSTAGAIASFCFDMNTPVLDGNVKRVLRRWHGSPEASEKTLWVQAQDAIDASGRPDLWNQAMMELGATLCLSSNPSCIDCPVHQHCDSAFGLFGKAVSKAALVRNVHWQVKLHLDAKKGIWLTRRPDDGIWAGLWTPPITELDSAPDESPCHIHQLTHRRLHFYTDIIHTEPGGQGQWVKDIRHFALPTGIHHLLAKHGIRPVTGEA